MQMSSSATGIPHESGPPRQLEQAAEKQISRAYFEWLYQKVYDVWDFHSEDSYTTVCWHMNQVIFDDRVPHDDNRVADAAGLRNEFSRFAGSLGPQELTDLMTPDATVLEVLIALADRAEPMVPLGIKVWFQIFVENLRLDQWNDPYCLRRSTWPIEARINEFNNRQYSPNGQGGIFPLRRPAEDQRRVELWYQMGAYMKEKAMY